MAATRMITARVANARKEARGRRRLLIGLACAVCFLVVNGIVGEHGAFALLRARAQYTELARTVAGVREENARVREQARRLLSDPAAVEDIARRELGLIKPGEKVFIVRPAPGGKEKP